MHKYILIALLTFGSVANAGGGVRSTANLCLGLFVTAGVVVGGVAIGTPLLFRHFLTSTPLHSFVSDRQAFEVLVKDWETLPDNAKKAMRRFADRASENGNENYHNQLAALEKASSTHQ
jgi:hypothetical protein